MGFIRLLVGDLPSFKKDQTTDYTHPNSPYAAPPLHVTCCKNKSGRRFSRSLRKSSHDHDQEEEDIELQSSASSQTTDCSDSIRGWSVKHGPSYEYAPPACESPNEPRGWSVEGGPSYKYTDDLKEDGLQQAREPRGWSVKSGPSYEYADEKRN